MQIKLTPPPHHHTIYTAELDEPNKSGKLSKTVAFTTTVRGLSPSIAPTFGVTSRTT